MSIEVNEKVSPEDFAKRMREIEVEGAVVGNWDWRHQEADKLLCTALRSLGYGEGVEIFERMGKWYS